MSSAKATQRKALDSRIQALIQNGVLQQHRSFFVMIGSPKEQQRQVVNLHYLLTQARLSSPAAGKTNRPSVLWTYKKDLGFTSNRKKRESKVKRDVKRGIRDEGDMDPFELFLGVTDIRYTYYKDTEKVLGQTFGMLVLQDFEAVTPNLLARTIETVEGGGLVVLLLQSMTSLKQLYTMSMDVHSRYRSSSQNTGDPVARFNERFILSLGSCPACLVLDDELNVLPLSQGKHITPLDASSSKDSQSTKDAAELAKLIASLADTQPVGEVVKHARTLDQARAILTFTDAIASKTLSSTVALTAARGRGKSAALGLSIALAIAHSYSNIFVTSPSPENLKTCFEFVLKGFDALGYQEHLDYDVVQSANPDWKGAVVRINVFKDHRQTIQYIQPQDAHVLGQAELVVIDEAAAIPLPLVKNLIGPYLVFMASTVNGYEGTGRSLSLKLISNLRDLSRASNTSASSSKPEDGTSSSSNKKKGNAALMGATGSLSRSLAEIKLDAPIRYGPADPIEKWLNSLLCLDATISPQSSLVAQGCPHPSACELFAVDRDTLFSYHPASEMFLQRMMALYVSSHYKNSPNDLQLMSDAPGHRLFVLLPPLKEEARLPEPLVVMQVAMEGNIARQSVLGALSRGVKAGGDLIPWTMSQQFQDDEFATLSGVRIVRIAVHPDYAKMGYGTKALELLDAFYSGKLLNLDEAAKELKGESYLQASKVAEGADLHTDTIKIRDPAKMPPLLHRLSELQPEQLNYLGVSYGLTPSLFKFWKRAGYVPMYIRQTANDLTGEHTCIMIRSLSSTIESNQAWITSFAQDFRKRFLALLSFKFREFAAVTSLSVVEAATSNEVKQQETSATLTSAEAASAFSPYDMKRLLSYANNMLDYHVILDLLPTLAGLYFSQRFPDDCHLSAVQASILLAIGLQRKSVEDIEAELKLPVSQSLALFVKVIRKLAKHLEGLRGSELANQIPTSAEAPAPDLQPVGKRLSDELAEGAQDFDDQLKRQQREAVDALQPEQYAVAKDTNFDGVAATLSAAAGGKKSQIFSVPKAAATSSGKRKADFDHKSADVTSVPPTSNGNSSKKSKKSRK